jgi:outer membrane protein OmpA-like peptidoglycan-associated protein
MFIKSRRPTSEIENVEESGYMASASDLMIGILFIFIVMVMVLLARKPEEPKEPPPDPLAAVVQAIGSRLQVAGVPVTINQASGVITLPADTLFGLGQPDLASDGLRTLKLASEQLQGILPCYVFSQRRALPTDCPPNPQQVEIETILIEGHTDASPLHRGDYSNWHLGLDRARAVYKVLNAGAMQNLRNEREQPVFGISSYADERPSDKTDPAKNRRVELRFVLAFQPNEAGNTKGPASTLKKMQETVR